MSIGMSSGSTKQLSRWLDALSDRKPLAVVIGGSVNGLSFVRSLAKRGVLVRHLVMPGLDGETRRILQFLAEEVAADTYVNVMNQYRPAGKVTDQKYAEINRSLNNSEYRQAVLTAQEFGLRLDQRRSFRRWAL